MPRVTLSNDRYRQIDFADYIRGQMKALHMTQSDMADALIMTQQVFSYRLRKMLFTYNELVKIVKILQIPDDKIVEYMTCK